MSITTLLGKTKLSMEQNAPMIGTIAGTVGMAFGMYEFYKAVRKIDSVKVEVVEELQHGEELKTWMTDCKEDPKMLEKVEEKLGQPLTEEYVAKVETGCKLKAYAKWVKLFAPSVTIIGVSMGCLVGGNIILNKRVQGLSLAYTALFESYKLYRNNVINKYGDDEDKNLLYGLKTEEIENEIVDEKGKIKTVKEKILVSEDKPASPYARFADESDNFMENMPEYNDAWIKGVENACNHKLKTYGYLFLNDVYKMLGMSELPNGVNVGWVLAGEHKKPVPGHDNFVCFDLTNVYNSRYHDGYEANCIIDFNVDGMITEIFPKYRKH